MQSKACSVELHALSTQLQCKKTRWRGYRRVPEWVLPRCWRAWVLDQGSLTKRLIKASEGNFAVRIVFQGWAYPRMDEARVLKLPGRKKALIREVELLCFGEPWVRARSIIPGSTLTGQERQLKHLGTRPLGAFLFKARTMRRTAVELASAITGEERGTNGRRSVFLLHDKPLLVSELFLPVMFTKPPVTKLRFSGCKK